MVLFDFSFLEKKLPPNPFLQSISVSPLFKYINIFCLSDRPFLEATLLIEIMHLWNTKIKNCIAQFISMMSRREKRACVEITGEWNIVCPISKKRPAVKTTQFTIYFLLNLNVEKSPSNIEKKVFYCIALCVLFRGCRNPDLPTSCFKQSKRV